MDNRIAVIGAGLSGLTAARALADAGRAVVVFEKSRGLGGRLATRRTAEGRRFDHGAPAVAGEGAFGAFLAGAVAQGRARATAAGVVGVPGMSALVGGLAEGLDIRFGVEACPVARDGASWRVADERFAGVICTAPAPQTARLCAAAPDIADAARAAVMIPCWTLMLEWAKPVPAPIAAPSPFAAVSPASDHPLRLVAHATPEWSLANLERAREAVADALAEALAAATGGRPAFAQAHRWRFARVVRVVGAPCVAQGSLVAAGDWLLGPDAAQAHASGLAAAAALRHLD